MKFYTVLAVVIFVAATTTTIQTYASTLSLEPPPPPALYMNGTQIALSSDANDRDIAISPLDDLPANGTQTISTASATDMDINEFPPAGVTVLIQKDLITVTNHTVTIDYGDDSDGDNGDEE